MKRFQLALVVATLVALGTLGAMPLFAQSPLPFFIMNAETQIIATITLADGQVVNAPIDIAFTIRSEEEGAYLELVANPIQPANAVVVVDDSKPISASLAAIVYRDAPTPVVVAPPTLVPVSTPTVAVVIVPPTPGPTAAPAVAVATTQPAQGAGPTFDQVCKADTGNMTDPQIATFANQYVGQTFTGWDAWVYDVVSKADGTYDLSLSSVEQWPFWGRDIVIENIPTNLATRLNVNQKLVLSGRIAAQ